MRGHFPQEDRGVSQLQAINFIVPPRNIVEICRDNIGFLCPTRQDTRLPVQGLSGDEKLQVFSGVLRRGEVQNQRILVRKY
jgi:hypothetical protein